MAEEIAVLPARNGRAFGFTSKRHVYKHWHAAVQKAQICDVTPHEGGAAQLRNRDDRAPGAGCSHDSGAWKLEVTQSALGALRARGEPAPACRR
jgi:hypothetical protein